MKEKDFPDDRKRKNAMILRSYGDSAMNAKLQKIVGFDAADFFAMSNCEYLKVLKSLPTELIEELNKEERYAVRNDDLASATKARSYYGSNNTELKGEGPREPRKGSKKALDTSLEGLKRAEAALLEKATSLRAEIVALTIVEEKAEEASSRSLYASLKARFEPIVSRKTRK